MSSSLLITNIKQLFQVEISNEQQSKKTWIAGSDMSNLPYVNNAYILIENDTIADFGSMEECPARADKTINAFGKTVLPTWCDSHTHIVYAKSREKEFVMRIEGKTYAEIASSGGGILNSAFTLNNTSEEQLFEDALMRVHEVIGYGTGALEIKSGYGLTIASELKILRVIKRLKETVDIPIKATFLGAHAIPLAFKNHRNDYIKQITDQMLPRIADEGLADYIDVFCDTGFFTVVESDIILAAGVKYGLIPKVHANELDYSGGVQLGVKHKAISVDHLECVGEAEINALLDTTTMPTLLPSTAFFLNLEYAPARQLIDAGLPVALASDYNPGTTPSGKIPFVLSLACLKMNMLPEEAVNAATLNSAYAMGINTTHGSIMVGKKANLIITKNIPSLAYLPYSFGSDLIDKVIINGKLV